MPFQDRRDAAPTPGAGDRASAPRAHRDSHGTDGVGSKPPTPPALVAMGPGSEIELVKRAMSGDASAFDALVARRLTPTFRLARAILGGTEEAEDATQEAFISAWRGLPSLREPERFDAWFGRIVINACRMSMRRRPASAMLRLETVADRQSAHADDPGLIGLVNSDALNRAIDGLPVQQRAILALYYLEDRPVSSVALILGIPTGTAKWRLSLARTALRRAMADDDGGAPALATHRTEHLHAAEVSVPLQGESA
jgi:RNA polymerase sigma-70 factor, ECF subfamily